MLLEAFDEQDIELAHDLTRGARGGEGVLVGVNCRDLVTLQVVPGRLEQLAPLLPTSVPRVAESGVGSAQDARARRRAGLRPGAGGQRADAGSAIPRRWCATCSLQGDKQ